MMHQRIRIIDCPIDFDITLGECKACSSFIRIVEDVVECKYDEVNK